MNASAPGICKPVGSSESMALASDTPSRSPGESTGVAVPGRAEAPRLYLTGERTLPGIDEETYWFARHVAGYEIAIDATRNATRVLDSGCGEGYGAGMLADAPAATGGAKTRLCTGIDVYADAVAHAAHEYPQARFVRSDAALLPFAAASFDAVVSLQVIEHLCDPAAYAAECRRVLGDNATLVCATPNRLTFTPPGRPKNPFHIVEFSPDELASMLSCHFGSVEMLGLTDTHPGLADALIDSAFAATDPPAWAQDLVPSVSTDDFVTTDDLDGCLDLVAICNT